MKTASQSQLVDLDDPSARDPAVCGTKAALLARLRAEGLSVPDGIVIPVELSGWLVDGGADAHGETRIAARAAVRRLGDVPVAVRSSGVEEDLPDASFAGQYETFVGVRGRGDRDVTEVALGNMRSLPVDGWHRALVNVTAIEVALARGNWRAAAEASDSARSGRVRWLTSGQHGS
jgi:pyruvate,water dikinase